MRLLHTKTLQFQEYLDADIPRYAILSHRWGEGEVTFKEMRKGKAPPGPGLTKIQSFCELAASRGHEWAWIDTCCIDKRSSAELSEAINAMYRWYAQASECYVHLFDFDVLPHELSWVHDDGGVSSFHPGLSDRLRNCSWFTRGWTLQELLAPARDTVYFFDTNWCLIGSLDGIASVISGITGIEEHFFSAGEKPSVAQRMSWASSRRTSRDEDITYCLLGLFNVNMSLIYGEGAKNAFRRLQIEIMNRDDDESLFAWTSNAELSGMLAQSPRDFANSGDIIRTGGSRSAVYSMSNKGLGFPVPNHLIDLFGHSWISLHCHKKSKPNPIMLHFWSNQTSYFRVQCHNSEVRIRPSISSFFPGDPIFKHDDGVVHVMDPIENTPAKEDLLEKFHASSKPLFPARLVIWDPAFRECLPLQQDEELALHLRFEDGFC
ncbi:MAG: hypothetical protein Q9210_006568 [Variospora velana]